MTYVNVQFFCGVIRNIQFFGLESQEKVTQSYIVVIGLGGVGSHAATMLLRSGVGRLLLVDFDQVPIFGIAILIALFGVKFNLFHSSFPFAFSSLCYPLNASLVDQKCYRRLTQEPDIKRRS